MKKKSTKKKEVKVDSEKKDLPSSTGQSIEKEFDFGGVPDRNLKKNLGCG